MRKFTSISRVQHWHPACHTPSDMLVRCKTIEHDYRADCIELTVKKYHQFFTTFLLNTTIELTFEKWSQHFERTMLVSRMPQSLPN